MAEAEQFIEEGITVPRNKLVVHTPIAHDSRLLHVKILLTPFMIERVSEDCLRRTIKDHEPAGSRAEALENWIGRFATSEVYQELGVVQGWFGQYHCTVQGMEAATPQRKLPFLLTHTHYEVFTIVGPETRPELFQAEQAFTERALAALTAYGVLNK